MEDKTPSIKQEQLSKIVQTARSYGSRFAAANPKTAQFITKNLPYANMKALGLWTLGPPALFLSWRAGQVLFGLAPRKCGVFVLGPGSPGRDVCVSRYRIQGLTKQHQALKQLLSIARTKGATQEQIKSLEEKIASTESKIAHYNMKIKQLLGKQAAQSQTMYRQTNKMASQTREQQEPINEIIPIVAPLAGLAFAIVAGVFVDAITFRMWRTLKMMFDQATRKCGIYKRDEEHDLCVSKERLKILKQQYAILQKAMNMCPKNRNPVKCKEKLDKEIVKIREKIQLYTDNITALQNVAQQKRAMEAQR